MEGVIERGGDSADHFGIGSVEAQVCRYCFVIILILFLILFITGLDEETG